LDVANHALLDLLNRQLPNNAWESVSRIIDENVNAAREMVD
jgi:hypothetical protein